ncbi:ParA family protein [Rhodoluna sp.]|uniref:ParA family protein n=1 Tax=Rhodoluna sp. TaxID=1969481 RepID=UPI002600DBBD|nr:ParA family protein [Rhodoluna sp.]
MAESKKKATDTRFPTPKRLANHGPARIIAMCNQKGGVGKTTTSINMSAALAEYGRKVLLVDFDPQGALSAGLGVNAHETTTIYDLMLDRNLDPHSAIQQTSVKNLDVIPANIELSAAEMKLVNEIAREQILAKILKQVADDYDLIIIDCQPSLGLLTVNALTAAHGVIIPLATEFFALRGVAILEDIISKVKEGLNPALQLDGILATMYDPRTLHSREVLERLHDAFGQKVFRSVINRTVKFPDATVAQSPITSFAPDSEAASSYRTVARELVDRGCAP